MDIGRLAAKGACVLSCLVGAGCSVYTLTVEKDGSGSGRVVDENIIILGAAHADEIDCGERCSWTALEGIVTVNLLAEPDAGSVLAGWLGCDSSDDLMCVVKLDRDRTVVATFELETP